MKNDSRCVLILDFFVITQNLGPYGRDLPQSSLPLFEHTIHIHENIVKFSITLCTFLFVVFIFILKSRFFIIMPMILTHEWTKPFIHTHTHTFIYMYMYLTNDQNNKIYFHVYFVYSDQTRWKTLSTIFLLIPFHDKTVCTAPSDLSENTYIPLEFEESPLSKLPIWMTADIVTNERNNATDWKGSR